MSLVGSEFLVSHRKLCTPIHFHRLSPLELYITTNTGLSPKGESIPAFYYPTHILIFIYTTVRLCWTLSNGTEPTQSNTKRSVDYNPALKPIQCNVLTLMQCNASLHVISRHMYNECYLDNIIHTTHLVSWTITDRPPS